MSLLPSGDQVTPPTDGLLTCISPVTDRAPEPSAFATYTEYALLPGARVRNVTRVPAGEKARYTAPPRPIASLRGFVPSAPASHSSVPTPVRIAPFRAGANGGGAGGRGPADSTKPASVMARSAAATKKSIGRGTPAGRIASCIGSHLSGMVQPGRCDVLRVAVIARSTASGRLLSGAS